MQKAIIVSAAPNSNAIHIGEERRLRGIFFVCVLNRASLYVCDLRSPIQKKNAMRSGLFLAALAFEMLVALGSLVLLKHVRGHENKDIKEGEITLYVAFVYIPATLCCVLSVWFSFRRVEKARVAAFFRRAAREITDY